MALLARTDRPSDRRGEPRLALPLRIYVLGRFEVEAHRQVVATAAWQRRSSARTLVKLLAISPNHQLHRDQVVEYLWPNVSLGSALNTFAKALHAARRALGETQHTSYLEFRNGLVSINSDVVWIDSDEFEKRAAEALTRSDLVSYDSALALYGGELLPEERYAEWSQRRRDELAQLHLRLLEAQAAAFVASQAPGHAAESLLHVLRADPARESAHRELMRLYWITGHRLDALRQYRECREALHTEFGAEPDAETLALYEQIAAGLTPPHLLGRTSSPASRTPPVALPLAVQRIHHSVFVSREHSRQVLLDALSRASDMDGSMVLIGGEDGIGKTRLAAEFAHDAHERGAAVLWATTKQHERVIPYACVVEALESYVGGLAPTEQEQIIRAHRDIALLLPRVVQAVQVSRKARAPALHDQAQLYRATEKLLEELSLGRALVLVLDDFHHSDEDSVNLVRHLAQLTPQRRWLVVITYRVGDVERGSAFSNFGAEAVREGYAQRIELQRLRRAEADRLIDSLLAGSAVNLEARDRLFELSRGNPLYLCELVEDWKERNKLVQRKGEWFLSGPDAELVPRHVADVLASRIERLTDDEVRVVEILAAAATEVPSSKLRATVTLISSHHVTDLALFEAIERLRAGGLIEERFRGYALQSPILQGVVYGAMSETRRRLLHSAIAQVIERTEPREADTLARHFGVSGQDSKALAYMEQAADRARDLHANETAVADYRELLARYEAAASTLDAARVAAKLGEVLTTMARYDAALEVLSKVAQVYAEEGDPERAGEAVAAIGIAHYYRGSPAEGIPQLEHALGKLQDGGPSKASARLAIGLIHLYFGAGQYSNALSAALKATAFAEAIGDEALTAEAIVDHGIVLVQLGRIKEGREVLASAIPRVEASGDLAFLCAALNNIARTHMLRGERSESMRYVERALEIAEQIGDPARIAFMNYRVGVNAYLGGDYALARLCFEQAIVMGDAVGDYWASAYPVLALARLSQRTGDYDRARLYVGKVLELLRRRGSALPWLGPHSLLTEEALVSGHIHEAHQQLDALRGVLEATDVASSEAEDALLKLLSTGTSA